MRRFALASAVEQVLFEELGRLGALSLQDLGRLNERLRAHNLLQDKGAVDNYYADCVVLERGAQFVQCMICMFLFVYMLVAM